MTIEQIQQICEQLKGVTQDIKWENHLCFSIGGKMFLVTAPDSLPPTASIKVSDEDFETLPMRDGITPAPYMARHKWVHLESINLFSKKDWQHYIKQAYDIVASKLPSKVQRAIKDETTAPTKRKKAAKTPYKR